MILPASLPASFMPFSVVDGRVGSKAEIFMTLFGSSAETSGQTLHI
jgi:hypothetical protein